VDESEYLRRIFVGGLPPTVTEEEFKDWASKFGEVEDAIILYDAVSNKSRGFGFVSFKDEESVARVLSQSSVHEFHGKTIEIKRALPRDQRVGVGGWPFPGVLPGAGVNPAVLGMPHMGALLGAGAGYPLPSVGHALPGFNAGMPGLVVPGPGAAALPQQYHLAQLRMAQAQQQMMQQHYASLAMPASVGPLNPMLSPGYEQSQPPLVPQRSMGLASRGMAAANPLTGVLEAAGVPSLQTASANAAAANAAAASAVATAAADPTPQNVAVAAATANAAVMAAKVAADVAGATAAADPTAANVEQAQTAAATAATASIIDAAITAMAEKRADEARSAALGSAALEHLASSAQHAGLPLDQALQLTGNGGHGSLGLDPLAAAAAAAAAAHSVPLGPLSSSPASVQAAASMELLMGSLPQGSPPPLDVAAMAQASLQPSLGQASLGQGQGALGVGGNAAASLALSTGLPLPTVEAALASSVGASVPGLVDAVQSLSLGAGPTSSVGQSQMPGSQILGSMGLNL